MERSIIMDNNFIDELVDKYMSGYKNTSRYKDDTMMEILFRKADFEKNLDDMWANYTRGVASQIVNYIKGLDNIKRCGLKVFRNSAGKHKIVAP